MMTPSQWERFTRPVSAVKQAQNLAEVAIAEPERFIAVIMQPSAPQASRAPHFGIEPMVDLRREPLTSVLQRERTFAPLSCKESAMHDVNVWLTRALVHVHRHNPMGPAARQWRQWLDIPQTTV